MILPDPLSIAVWLHVRASSSAMLIHQTDAGPIRSIRAARFPAGVPSGGGAIATLHAVAGRPSRRPSPVAQSASFPVPDTLSRRSMGTVCSTSPTTAGPSAALLVGEEASIASGFHSSYAWMPRTSRW